MKKKNFLYDECMDKWMCIYCGAYADIAEHINHYIDCYFEKEIVDETDRR